jgi:hypothetical protein
MKHWNTFIFLLLALVACNRDDDGGSVSIPGDEELSAGSPVDKRVKEMQDKYAIIFRHDFNPGDLTYNWTEALPGMPYTPADTAHVIPVLDFIEREVFSLFPEGFIKKYLQANILLVDSLKFAYDESDEITGVERKLWNSLPGHVTRNALVISHVSKDFDPTSTAFKEDLVSLFVERMMVNANLWPRPDAFAAIAEADAAVSWLSKIYWDGDLNTLAYWWGSVPEGFVPGPEFPDAPPPAHEWLRSGILKMGRLGYRRVTIAEGTGPAFITYCGTLGQDFGDYVSFIISKTVAEKEAYYTYLASQPDTFFATDTEIVRTGAEVVERLRAKVRLVKEYFRRNFDIELKDHS